LLTARQQSATAKAIQQVYSQEDESIRLALEAIANSTTPAQVASSTSASGSGPTVLAQDTPSDRPLILYAYSESKELGASRFNLEFFLKHGLHAEADFLFILNGPTKVAEIIPDNSNIRVVQRKNDCYDLGAYAEVLTKDGLYKKYRKFIMLNASIRGPFVPYWSRACWTDMYLGRITEEVKVCPPSQDPDHSTNDKKLVGMTANCWPSMHVQSMIWATDIVGLFLLLSPPASIVRNLTANPTYDPHTETETGVALPPHYGGINSCFHTWGSAVSAEIGSSALIKAAGYRFDVMMAAFHGAEDYSDICDATRDGADPLWDGQYFGGNVHPYETVFMKSNRDVDPIMMDRLTEWTGKNGYSSFEACQA